MDVESAIRNACRDQGWTCAETMIELEFEDGRRHRVWRKPPSAEDHVVRFYSYIGEGAALNEQRLRAALGLNFNLEFGALALKGDDIVLVDTLLKDEITPHAVTELVNALGQRADEFERLLFHTDQH